MATHVGKDGSVSVGGNTVAEMNSWEITESAELLEDSEASDEWRTFKSGTDVVKEWAATITCWWDETDSTGQEAALIGASLSLIFYGEGEVSGDQTITGTGIVEERGIALTKSGITERTITVKGTGALVYGVVA